MDIRKMAEKAGMVPRGPPGEKTLQALTNLALDEAAKVSSGPIFGFHGRERDIYAQAQRQITAAIRALKS